MLGIPFIPRPGFCAQGSSPANRLRAALPRVALSPPPMGSSQSPTYDMLGDVLRSPPQRRHAAAGRSPDPCRAACRRRARRASRNHRSCALLSRPPSPPPIHVCHMGWSSAFPAPEAPPSASQRRASRRSSVSRIDTGARYHMVIRHRHPSRLDPDLLRKPRTPRQTSSPASAPWGTSLLWGKTDQMATVGDLAKLGPPLARGVHTAPVWGEVRG